MARIMLWLVCAAGALGCSSVSDGIGRTCDLFSDACDFEIRDCYLITVDNLDEGLMSGETQCLGTGTLGQGETCEFLNDCASGLGCVLGRSLSDPTLVCAQYCDVNGSRDGPTCPATFTCREINKTYGNAGGVADGLGFCVPADWDS